MTRNQLASLRGKTRTGPEEEARALLKEICSCPLKHVDQNIKRLLPKLLSLATKPSYSFSEDYLTLLLWASSSLIVLSQILVSNGEKAFEAQMLRIRVEQEHLRVMTLFTRRYRSTNVMLQDYFGFISTSGIWNEVSTTSRLLDLIPTKHVFVEDLVINSSSVLLDEYWKGNTRAAKNILDNTSYLMDKEWPSSSFGAQRCVNYLLEVYESLYQADLTEDLMTASAILVWIEYFVKRLSQPEHISDVLDLLCFWLYLHASDVRQVIDIGSLIFLCADTYKLLLEQFTLKHFFQDVVLCLINSDDLSTVSIGYDIVISITDRLGNKRHFDTPKLYGSGELNQFKKTTRRFVEETLFFREDFVYMTDAVHKVVLNSVNRFIESRILAKKVNTLVSILALEGCDSAQGLMSVISLALGVQDAMLRRVRKLSKEEPNHPDQRSMFYHSAVASWFTLLCSVNSGDLDLLRNYVKTVVDLRADSAPYLLPTSRPPLFLSHYIYELDKNLFFDVDLVQAAIENSWVVLTNNRELLNYVKIPRSSILVEKYVDLQFLDSFDAYRSDEKINTDPSSLCLMDDIDTLFRDVENRYSEAFTEPYDRFQFEQLSLRLSGKSI